MFLREGDADVTQTNLLEAQKAHVDHLDKAGDHHVAREVRHSLEVAGYHRNRLQAHGLKKAGQTQYE